MTTPNLREWEAKANEIPPSALRQAVKLALWLIADKGKPIAYAVKIAANEHGATQTATRRQVKAIIPAEFFTARSLGSARQIAASGSKEQQHQRRHLVTLDNHNRQHLAAMKDENDDR